MAEGFNDSTPMPFGKYKGDKLANVPAEYLMWLLDNNKVIGHLKNYIEENKDVLAIEIKTNKQVR